MTVNRKAASSSNICESFHSFIHLYQAVRPINTDVSDRQTYIISAKQKIFTLLQVWNI